MSKINGCKPIKKYECTVTWEQCKYYTFGGDEYYSRICIYDNGIMECVNPEAIKEAESGEGE